MKQAKKLLALLLVAVLVISLGSLTAFAADGDDPVDNPSGGNDAPAATGSITLNNATKGEEYKLYKVFDLTYGGDGEGSNGSQANPANLYSPVAYTYTKKSGDTDAFLTALQGAGSPFVLTQIGETGVYNVALKEGSGASEISAFLTAQKANLTPAVATAKVGLDDDDFATDAGNISWSGLPYGYYYVTSSLGSAVTVDSTLPNVTIQDKNETVTVDKEVKEDSNGVNSKKNDADIGQVVEYTTTIHAVPNSTKLVLHDSMTEGLTFDDKSVVVKVDGTTLTEGTNYDLIVDPEGEDADDCTFEIDFAKYLSSITEKKDIVVTYKATLNENAVIGLPQNNGGNVNETYVDYGAKNTTEHDSTTTYTWEFDLFKYYKESKDSTDKKALAGAKFSFKQGEKIVYLKKDATDTANDKYIVVAVSATAPKGTEGTDWVKQITTTEKKVVIVGLDADTYTVTEDEAPAGYNKLTEPLTVKIEGLKEVTDDNGVKSNELNTDPDPASGTVYQTVKKNGEDTNVELANKTLEIENNKGTELPSTGGIGTTIFYVVGGLLLVGAGILLVTKKRVGNDV